jgi:CDP-diacylglycerol--glycerol-3-phosphate 3-phosphatidyltransferase
MRQGSLVSHEARDRIRSWAVPIATALGRLGLTPNALTVLGFLGTCMAAVAAGAQAWALAGVLVLLFGIFDMFDGALARATGRTTRFGSFLDSTLDRTGENLVLAGIAFGLAMTGSALGVGVAALALAFSSMVTYARAKAESLGVHGEVGMSPRPERLVIIGGGLISAGVFAPDLYLLGLALTIVAIAAAITVLQRIVHVRKQLNQQENP